MIGTCFSLIIGSLKEDKIMDALDDLSEFFKPKPDFTSSEEDIKMHRKLYHCYRVTEFTKGQPCWQYSIVDFTKSIDDGKLVAVETILDSAKKKCYYDVTGGKREEKLIIFRKARESNEPIAISLFPGFGWTYDQINCGIQVHQNFVGDQKFDPMILCLSHIGKHDNDGDIPTDIQEKLTMLWKKKILNIDNMSNDYTLHLKEENLEDDK